MNSSVRYAPARVGSFGTIKKTQFLIYTLIWPPEFVPLGQPEEHNYLSIPIYTLICPPIRLFTFFSFVVNDRWLPTDIRLPATHCHFVISSRLMRTISRTSSTSLVSMNKYHTTDKL